MQLNKRAMILRSIKDIKKHKERLNRLDSFKTVIYIMVAVIFYYTFIAADRYVSEVSLSVKSTDGNSPVALSGIESLIGIPSSSTEDIRHLQEYLDWFVFIFTMKRKFSLNKIKTESYNTVVLDNNYMKANAIFKIPLPIDLNIAYSEYFYQS